MTSLGEAQALIRIEEVCAQNGMPEDAEAAEWIAEEFRVKQVFQTQLIRLVQSICRGRVAGLSGTGTVIVDGKSKPPAGSQMSIEAYEDNQGNLFISTKVVPPKTKQEEGIAELFPTAVNDWVK